MLMRAIQFCFVQELNWAFEVAGEKLFCPKKKNTLYNECALHRALTPKLDTVPSEHTLLVVFSHPFIRHADGLLGGPVL